MNTQLKLLLLSFCLSASLAADEIVKVAFGSCGNQNHSLPIFDEVVKPADFPHVLSPVNRSRRAILTPS